MVGVEYLQIWKRNRFIHSQISKIRSKIAWYIRKFEMKKAIIDERCRTKPKVEKLSSYPPRWERSGGIGMCLSWLLGNFSIPPLGASPLVEELTRPFFASVEHYHSYIASENSTSSQSSTVEEVWWIGFMLSQSSTVKDWDNINSFHHTLTSNCP